jgi:hypothetical protein
MTRKTVASGNNAERGSAKSTARVRYHSGRVLTVDASSFAMPRPTMDKMTFLVDKLTVEKRDE